MNSATLNQMMEDFRPLACLPSSNATLDALSTIFQEGMKLE